MIRILAALAVALLPTIAAAAGFVDINAHDVDLSDVIRLLGTQARINVVPDGSIKREKITLRLRRVSFDQALGALARAYDLQAHRENGIVVIGSATSMNRRFGDARSALAAKTAVLPLRNAKPDDLVKPLGEALAPGSIVIADRRSATLVVTGSDATLARARALVAALDAPAPESGRAPHAIPLRYVRATEAAKLLKGVVPDGSAVADDRQNAVVATGTPEIAGSVRAFLDEIDRPARQVLLEVRVVDVRPQNDISNVGVQFGGVDIGGQYLTGATSYAFARNSVQINARLNFLVSKGTAKILATPRLVTLNNREASLLIGQTYPIIYFDIRSGNQQIQTIDIGVKLRMTPTIGADGSITAELHPEYSEIQDFVQNYPIIANRRVDSTLRVQDGQTIVLGGLLREVTSETVTKLPLLGDVPVFGEIFKNRQKTRERDEIVFLITPRIIDSKESAEN